MKDLTHSDHLGWVSCYPWGYCQSVKMTPYVTDTDIKMPPIPRDRDTPTDWHLGGRRGDQGDKKYGKTKEISHNNLAYRPLKNSCGISN